MADERINLWKSFWEIRDINFFRFHFYFHFHSQGINLEFPIIIIYNWIFLR